MSRRPDNLYQIRQVVTMSQRLVKQDASFKRYAGADVALSEEIAVIDALIDARIVVLPQTIATLRKIQTILMAKNKAIFAATCSELSKLSFHLGMIDDTITATADT